MGKSEAQLESEFQGELILKLKEMFPGCEILKNDANYRQGFPDLTILFESRFAILEVKAYEGARYRPNQEWYLAKWEKFSFSETIYPENEEEILRALSEFFNN